MKFEIKHRWSRTVLFEAELGAEFDAESYQIRLGAAVKLAVKAHADLTGANLAGANLAHADLTGANLAGANLAHADLTGANLAGANLAGANLAGANLAHADLTAANLTDAYLGGANLTDAYLAGANLARANLTAANLTDAFKVELKDIPIVPNIDAAILAAIEAGGTLNMGGWHGEGGVCGTTHCRAGWAIHLAGEKGHALERRVGPHRAGAMIYRASRPGPAPWFFAPDEVALADIRKCAAEQLQSGKPK